MISIYTLLENPPTREVHQGAGHSRAVKGNYKCYQYNVFGFPGTGSKIAIIVPGFIALIDGTGAKLLRHLKGRAYYVVFVSSAALRPTDFLLMLMNV